MQSLPHMHFALEYPQPAGYDFTAMIAVRDWMAAQTGAADGTLTEEHPINARRIMLLWR